jgi:peptidoglycan/xylan/chitin deacetylase (PgdA/CDA1 family)
MSTTDVSAILTYHSIDKSGSVISTTPELFRAQIQTLRAANTPICRLAEIHRRPGSVAITFDDGFENFREHALPILVEYKIPATVFVVSGYCGRDNGWPSQSAQAPRLRLMDWDGLNEISAAGCEIGAHTVTHPDLTTLTAAQAERELLESREEIQQRTAHPVHSFAFPYGAVDGQIAQIAGAYFERACGTRLDFVTKASDDIQLPRIDAYYLRNPQRLATLLQRGGRCRIAVRRWLREARQWTSR